MLRHLLRYRVLTRELLEILYAAERGRGGTKVREHLTNLYRHAYVERFFRPTDYGQGSRQYVYVIRPEGMELVVDPEEWGRVRPRVHKLLKPRRDFEHGLAVSLVHVLWDLGAQEQAEQLRTYLFWQDKEGEEKGTPKNRFTVRVDRKPVVIDPDSTVLTAQKGEGDWYARPLFFEIERTHKNTERLTRRFRAYQELVGDQAVLADRVFGREVKKDIFPAERGMVVFFGADHRHRDRLRDLAVETVGKGRGAPEFWFVSLDDLFDTRTEADPKTGKERRIETIMPPPEFFRRELAVRLDGRRGTLLPRALASP